MCTITESAIPITKEHYLSQQIIQQPTIAHWLGLYKIEPCNLAAAGEFRTSAVGLVKREFIRERRRRENRTRIYIYYNSREACVSTVHARLNYFAPSVKIALDEKRVRNHDLDSASACRVWKFVAARCATIDLV